MDKKFWATTFTLTGTIIGAGILGIPGVFSRSGFLIGLFWLILIGAIMIFVNLCLAEVALRTKGNHQLPGYAEKYLGKKAKIIMFFAMIFGVYSALLAYLVGEGESLSKIIPGNINPLILGILFWLILTFLLREGLKGLKKVETYGVIAIIVIVAGIFLSFLPQVSTSNLTYTNTQNLFLPIGVVLFALLGFTSIPELRREIKGSENKFKKAIILGSSIPIILYILFSLIFVGIFGPKVPEVATLAFGAQSPQGIIVTLLGVFTMLTSYLVLSFSIRDVYKYDLNLGHQKTFFLASLLPLLIYLLISIFELASFSQILSIGGVISAGLTGILILLISKKAKKVTRNEKTPEIKMPINWTIIIALSIIFITGIILEFI